MGSILNCGCRFGCAGGGFMGIKNSLYLLHSYWPNPGEVVGGKTEIYCMSG